MDLPAPWTARAPPTGPWTPGPTRRASTCPQALDVNHDRTFHVLIKPDILTYYEQFHESIWPIRTTGPPVARRPSTEAGS
jgi:hypothetical protein